MCVATVVASDVQQNHEIMHSTIPTILFTLSSFMTSLTMTVTGVDDPTIGAPAVAPEVDLLAKYRDSTLTPENLYYCIVDAGIEWPTVVWRQAIHETGNLTSRNCTKNNNLFGMKHASRRKTTSLGNRGMYAAYAHWSYSVEDYKHWQDLKPVRGDYYGYLRSRGYAEDPAYVAKLKRIKLPEWIHRVNAATL